MSFRIVNLVAHFLIFFALSRYDGNCSSLMYDRIEVVLKVVM